MPWNACPSKSLFCTLVVEIADGQRGYGWDSCIFNRSNIENRASKSTGAPLPEKDYGWQKKLEEYFQKKKKKILRKKKGGLRMLILFLNMTKPKPRSFRKRCPWTPAKGLASRPRLHDKPLKDGVSPSQFCSFLWNLFLLWSHVVNWSLKYGGVVSWFTFFNVFDHFLSTSTMPSTLTLVSICSLISLLWNKKSPRSLGCIIRKLQYKIYRYVPGGAGGWGAGGWGAHRVIHKIVTKWVTSCFTTRKVYMLEPPNCTQIKINS